MEIRFTKEEKLIIEEYASVVLNNPCDTECNDLDRRSCCGCPKKSDYDSEHKPVIDAYNHAFRNEVAKNFADEYVRSYLEVTYLRRDFDSLKKKLDEAENKLKRFEGAKDV